MNTKEAKTDYNPEEMQSPADSADLSGDAERTKILPDSADLSDDSDRTKMLTNSANLSDDSDRTKMLTNSANITDDSEKTKMLNLAVSMLRSGSGKNIGKILDGCGIPESDYLRWVQSGEFPALALPLSRSLAQSEAPLIWRSLLDMAKDGNTTAIRLYFDIFGRDMGESPNRTGDPGNAEISSLRSELFGGDSQ